jgi:hypothetical protein
MEKEKVLLNMTFGVTFTGIVLEEKCFCVVVMEISFFLD